MRPILDRVTVTGADASVDPVLMGEIQEQFPHVEWGILVSKHRTLGDEGCARFPPETWLAKLDPFLNLSVHICGKWVRQICKADWSWLDESAEVRQIIAHAQRIQLNFGSAVHTINREELAAGIKKHFNGQQVICQVDGINDDLVTYLHHKDCDVAALYDTSGGAGRLPIKWVNRLMGIYCGYAGGLSPENVVEQMTKIETVAEAPSWIDAETRLRSENNERLVISRVLMFLKGAESWLITKTS